MSSIIEGITNDLKAIPKNLKEKAIRCSAAGKMGAIIISWMNGWGWMPMRG